MIETITGSTPDPGSALSDPALRDPALRDPVLTAALDGLARPQKSLPPWLFYDDLGSHLFERITALPEYYLTRTERSLFHTHARQIIASASAPTDSPITIAELGAGSAAKTGILLRAAMRSQHELLYQPIDVSASALDAAELSITTHIPGVRIAPQLANYTAEPYTILRPAGHRVLALYIGSSIGNFSPAEAISILRALRSHLASGDALLLGVDLAPSTHKPVSTLLAAYNDAAGVTAAFNLNVLTRLNRDLAADFNPASFAHRALWNPACSRIEMHLESLTAQAVQIAGHTFHFAPGETLHTENSHKFTLPTLNTLLTTSGFTPDHTFTDTNDLFALTLARAA